MRLNTEVQKINKLIEFYRNRPIEEEDNIIILRALEFYRESKLTKVNANQSFPKERF